MAGTVLIYGTKVGYIPNECHLLFSPILSSGLQICITKLRIFTKDVEFSEKFKTSLGMDFEPFGIQTKGEGCLYSLHREKHPKRMTCLLFANCTEVKYTFRNLGKFINKSSDIANSSQMVTNESFICWLVCQIATV